MENYSSKISVIIPVYGVEDFLCECVDSVLNQTYPNLEIILVDDGSPDNSGQICDAYAGKDSRIKVIHKRNGGLSDARNAGLDISTGQYISFVDSDDKVHPQFIELLYSKIGKCDMIFCDFKSFENYPDLSNDRFKPAEKEKLTNFTKDELMLQIMSFRYPLVVVAWNKLYKRELWGSLRYPVGKIHEDEFIIHSLINRSENIAFIDKPVYYYRMRKQSIMSSASATRSLLDKLEALYLRKTFFDETLVEPEATMALNNEILFRCVLPSVSKENIVWERMDMNDILFHNTLSFNTKVLLLIKKKCYSLYSLAYKIRGLRDIFHRKQQTQI